MRRERERERGRDMLRYCTWQVRKLETERVEN